SRPSSSVPSQWPGVPGGFRRLTMLVLNGSAGAISGAKMAQSTIAKRMTIQTIATGSVRRRFARLRQTPRVRTFTVDGEAISPVTGRLGVLIADVSLDQEPSAKYPPGDW